MICPTCGAEVPNGMSVCLECGAIVGGAQKTNDSIYLKGQANWEKEAQKNMLRGMAGSVKWLSRVFLIQVILTAIGLVAAFWMFTLYSDPYKLFTTSGYNTLEFLTKLAEYMVWGQIAVTAATVVFLYLLSRYGRNFLLAALFVLIVVIMDILSERAEERSVRLAMDIVGIASQIAYAVFLFLQMAKVSEPFNKLVAAGWRGLIFWYILVNVAILVLGFIILYYIETMKGVELSLAIVGALTLFIETVTYLHTKKTYEIL